MEIDVPSSPVWIQSNPYVLKRSAPFIDIRRMSQKDLFITNGWNEKFARKKQQKKRIFLIYFN